MIIMLILKFQLSLHYCQNRDDQDLALFRSETPKQHFAQGYIVFVFLFVHSDVCSLLRLYFVYVKVLVKVSPVVYISVTSDQNTFIFRT